MSELRDRLERLATRGSPRGADNVISAAQRGVPTNEVDIVPDDNSRDLPIIDDSVPMVSTDTEREPRSRMRTLVAVFGIAALVGVGGLAVASIFGQGGADSPKGAVQQLADAISHKDPLAAVDVLSPTEVRSMRQSVDHVSHRAADLKIVDDASAPLAGVDLSVNNLQLSTQPLADGFTKVTVTGGEISASTHTAAMSKLLQDAIKDQGNTSDKVQLAKLAHDADLPTFLITVRHDGRWYISPAYTALEYARLAAGGPAADFGSAQAAKDLGADTPDHAVNDALHAWQAGDWNRLMALAPPDELPVYDYRAWIAQAASDSRPDFQIDALSTTSSISGDTATVQLDASGTMGSGQDRGEWQVGGTCANQYFGEYDYASSDTFRQRICLSGDLGNVVPFALIPIGDGSGDSPATGPVTIDLVRENGRWFISPVTTVLKAIDSSVEHIDERTVYSFLNLAYELPPDGSITLNQPFTVANHGGFFESSVYAFDGTKGQEVVGEIASKRQYASAEIYTADGKEVDYIDFSPMNEGGAYSAKLPATGSYRLIFMGGVPKDAKLTLWDVKQAPKGLVSGNGSGESCTSSIGGGETCSSQGFSNDAGSSSDSGGFSCTVTGNALQCPGSGSIPICASKAAENAANSACISKDNAAMLGSGGITTGTPTPTKTAGPVTAASAAAAQRAIDYANSATATISPAPTATTGAASSTP